MNRISKKLKCKPAFSLAEVLVALTIGAMVMVAVLTIYSRVENSAAAITRKLDGSRLEFEVLQRIAEDIDRAVVPGGNTKITVDNKFTKGLSTARLTISNTIYDSDNEEQIFDEVVWQANYDNDVNGLVLYRSHSGIALEDKLLDENKDDWEKDLFVPVCAGITFFKIQTLRGKTLQDKWAAAVLPYGIVVTVSFAEPFKTLSGTLDVPEDEKFTRNIAVDKIREVRFTFVKEEESNQK